MRLSIHILLVLSVLASFSQKNTLSNSQTLRNYSDRIGAVGTFTRTVPVVVGETKGSYFLYDDFSEFEVVMNSSNDTLSIKSANYHLELQTVVFYNESRLEMVQPIFLKGFVVKQGGEKKFKFINKRDLSSEKSIDVPALKRESGFLEILYDNSKGALYSEWILEVIKPTYNVALDVGARETVLKSERKFILIYENEYFDDFNLSKKSLKYVFGKRSKEASIFVKDNNLKKDNPDDVIRLLKHFLN